MATKKELRKLEAAGTIPRVYEDASGAPAILRYDGFTFAFDCVGKVSGRQIAPLSGAYSSAKRAYSACERTYFELLADQTDEQWHERNRALYEVA
jgi:hypothetical protein